MLRLFYNRNRTFHKLFWFFWNYFQDASLPTVENLFLLVISMLALDSFYYTLGYTTFDHLRWMAVTARLALGCIAPFFKRLYCIPFH